MKGLKLLDCTLRDGGYYTKWDFDSSFVNKYCDLISRTPIDYVEIGYRNRNRNRNGYFGEYYYTPLESISNIKGRINKKQKIALMIDAKEYEKNDISELLYGCDNLVDLIRIATNPEKIDHSLSIAKVIKKNGFEVALNIMYISKIDANHKIYEALSSSYIDYLYLVDSYGSIYPNELEIIINKFKNAFNGSLGFHGHNNIELAFSNTLCAINNNVKIIDSTILGMGRGAGNLKLELLLTHLKKKNIKKIDLTIISKLVELFMPLKMQYKWGVNLPYIVSGTYSIPQKNVMDAIKANRYTITSIVNTMNIPSYEKLRVFKHDLLVDSCIIIGGGKSIIVHLEALKKYFDKKPSIVIIHSSLRYIKFFSEVKNTQLFCVSGDEISKSESLYKLNFVIKIIFGPSPRKINIDIKKSNKNFELKKITHINRYYDSPLTLSLQVAIDIKSKNIELAGFDGYSNSKTIKEVYLMKENQEILNNFSNREETIVSITDTTYDGLKKQSIYEQLL